MIEYFCARELVVGFGELFPLGKEAEFGSLPSDLIDLSRDEVGDHLDGDADPQTVLQVVKLHRRPGPVPVGDVGFGHVSSPSFATAV